MNQDEMLQYACVSCNESCCRESTVQRHDDQPHTGHTLPSGLDICLDVSNSEYICLDCFCRTHLGLNIFEWIWQTKPDFAYYEPFLYSTCKLCDKLLDRIKSALEFNREEWLYWIQSKNKSIITAFCLDAFPSPCFFDRNSHPSDKAVFT